MTIFDADGMEIQWKKIDYKSSSQTHSCQDFLGTVLVSLDIAMLNYGLQYRDVPGRSGLTLLPAELSALEFCTTHTGSLIALFCAVPLFSLALILLTNNLGVDVLLLFCHMNEQCCCFLSKQGALATEKFQRHFQKQKSQLFFVSF